MIYGSSDATFVERDSFIMQKRTFGKTDLQVSPLGFGGAEIGFEQVPVKVVEKLLNEALDAGLNVIDTAECYVNSEELIGQTIGKRRSQFYLFTKCGHGDSHENPAWDKESLQKSIEQSLRRLKTDYVDLVQLHSCSEEILRKGEVIEVLQKAKKEGKTRFIGYSGDGTDALYAVEINVFDTLQTSVNIADQQALELTLPLALEKKMGVIAKRPLANAAWLMKSKPANDYYVPYWERLNQLKYDFIDHNGTDAVSVALRFTLTVPGVHTAIVGTSKPDRWRQNASLLSQGPLISSEFEAIRSKWKANVLPEWVGQV
jgi:aryl-alcohol dehydrogenase-like predicted oxidoreductase